MATVDERMTVLETRFDTELKHLATKADLKDLEMRLTKWMIGLMVSSVVSASAIAVAALRLWG